jgi:hypothetical protein
MQLFKINKQAHKYKGIQTKMCLREIIRDLPQPIKIYQYALRYAWSHQLKPKSLKHILHKSRYENYPQVGMCFYWTLTSYIHPHMGFEVLTMVIMMISVFLDMMSIASFTLKVKTAHSSKMFLNIFQTTWHHIPEDGWVSIDSLSLVITWVGCYWIFLV